MPDVPAMELTARVPAKLLHGSADDAPPSNLGVACDDVVVRNSSALECTTGATLYSAPGGDVRDGEAHERGDCYSSQALPEGVDGRAHDVDDAAVDQEVQSLVQCLAHRAASLK